VPPPSGGYKILTKMDNKEMRDCHRAVAIGWGDYLNAAIIWYYADDEPVIVGVNDVWANGRRMGVETLTNSNHAKVISNEQAKAIIATATTVADLSPHFLEMLDFSTEFFSEAHIYGTERFKEFCEGDADLKHFECDKKCIIRQL
jgi:uncharacterized membrane protein